MSRLASAVLFSVVAASIAKAADTDSLAEQAIDARYAAEKLDYEKVQAERTIKSSENRIKGYEKSVPKLRETVDKFKGEFEAVQAQYAEKSAAVEAAQNKGDEDAAQRLKTEADSFLRTLRAKESAWKRESSRLERSEIGWQDAKQAIVDAREAIPLKEAAAKKAYAAAAELRGQAISADRDLSKAQSPQAVAEKIDTLIDARLKEADIPASPLTDGGEFFRRASLDIKGVVPSYEDVVAFLEDTGPKKRSRAIEQLLAHEWYGRNLAQRFCTVTTESGTSTLKQARDTFNGWLAESYNLNRRWDRVVYDMLAAEGAGFEDPAVLFTVAYRMNEQPDPSLLLAAAGDYFLGLQIKCAQCHDHPFHEWTQQQFWGMATTFGRVRLKGRFQNARELEHFVTDNDVSRDDMVRMNGIDYAPQVTGGRIDIPDPVNAGEVLETVEASFLGGTRPELPEKGNYREHFARWVTSKDNPYFARATVNRLWAHFFGGGIVEPIENLHPDNEPTHPEVLDLLAEEFRNSDYDLKHIVRCITHTQAWQRTSRPVDGNKDDTALLSHMKVKPLGSYALVDSLWVALRRTPPTGSRRVDAAMIFDTRLPGGDPTKYTHSIPQVLKLMNSSEHLGVSGPAVQTVTRNRSVEEAIQHIYFAVLARSPSAVEAEEMAAYVESLDNERQAYGDIFWVLLNSAEFLVNH